MKKITQLLLLFLCSLLLTQCGWLFGNKEDDPKLPPATQEGKHTFGCLVNGEVWLPSGFNGRPNLQATYDPTYRWGTLNVRAFKSKDGKAYQSIGFYSDSLTSTGVYPLYLPGRQTGKFSDIETLCVYDREVSYVNGTLIITRLDLQQRIVSGTFEFTLAQPGCDTIRVTDGRFDTKF